MDFKTQRTALNALDEKLENRILSDSPDSQLLIQCQKMIRRHRTLVHAIQVGPVDETLRTLVGNGRIYGKNR